MNGKMKALGLALVATMAMSAVAAGSASAEPTIDGEFTLDPNATVLDVSGGKQTFSTTVDSFFCKSVSASVTAFGPEEATGQPHYTGCDAENLGVSVHVRMNSCARIFTADTTGEHAPIHIECDPEDEIEVNITFLGERPCFAIPGQTPTSGGLTYQNGTILSGETNVWDVTIKATVEGITYTEQSLCDDDGGEPTTGHDGVLTGEATVVATDNEENPVDITHHHME